MPRRQSPLPLPRPLFLGVHSFKNSSHGPVKRGMGFNILGARTGWKDILKHDTVQLSELDHFSLSSFPCSTTNPSELTLGQSLFATLIGEGMTTRALEVCRGHQVQHNSSWPCLRTPALQSAQAWLSMVTYPVVQLGLHFSWKEAPHFQQG